MRVLTYAVLAALLAAPGAARAAVIEVGSVSETVFGNEMAGAQVTVTFGNNTSETQTWVATGPQSGAATGTGWSLALNGDTFFADWVLTNNRSAGNGVAASSLITSIRIEPLAADVAFDTALGLLGLATGTPGSSLGTTFNGIPIVQGFSSFASLNVNATTLEVANLTGSTYIDDIALAGQSPAGDMHGSLFINTPSSFGLYLGFIPVTVNGIPGRVNGGATTFTFRADTDFVTAVPEPTSFALFGLATVAAGYFGWRRKRPVTA